MPTKTPTPKKSRSSAGLLERLAAGPVICARGPATMLPLLREVRGAVTGHVAALPVPYRTTPEEPTFQSLSDPRGVSPDGRPFPTALDPLLCSRYEIGQFGKAAFELGVRYLGVCCGAGPHHIRSLAEALGRTPPASRYSPDMSKHILFGTDKRLRQDSLEYGRRNYSRGGAAMAPTPPALGAGPGNPGRP